MVAFLLHCLRFAEEILWKAERGVLGFKQEAKRARSGISLLPSLLWSWGCKILLSWQPQVLVRINFANWEERTFLSLKLSAALLSNTELQIRDFFSFLN